MEGGSGEQISIVSIKDSFEMAIGIESFWPHKYAMQDPSSQTRD